MKNLTIKQNNYLLGLEHSLQTCEQMLNRSRSIRFDIVVDDDDENTTVQLLRVKLEMDEIGSPFLELKDYRDNQRYFSEIDPLDGMSDISTKALSLAWNLLDAKPLA